MTINVHEAKTHFSKLLARVAAGEEIIISRAGRPVARLVPFSQSQGKPLLGLYRGQIQIADDFDEMPADFMASFEP